MPWPPVQPEGDVAQPRHRGRRLRGVLVIAAAVSMAAAPLVNALFTDAAGVPANAFASGTVDVSVSPASAVVSATGMAPGDAVTAPMTVTNTASQDLRYAMTSTIDNTAGSISLAAQLGLRIRSGVTTCTTAGFDVDGANVYGGANGADLGSVAGINVIGDPAQGGDRTLAQGASEVLCVQVTLPATSGSVFQGLTTTATFSFTAEQVRNNP